MHISVLLEEAVTLWGGVGETNGERDGIYIDGTFGEGGHSKKLLDTLDHKKIKIIGLDWDEKRIKQGEQRFKKEIENKKLYLISEGFQNIQKVVKQFQAKSEFRGLPVRGVLLDLGMCSTQLEEARGFSFNEKEAKLDMRFKEKSKNHISAREILNDWSKEDLVEILRELGEERYAGLVAGAIVRRREEEGKFEKVEDLLLVLEKCVGRFYKNYRIHFATRTFQALRMAANQEVSNIKKGLEGAKEVVACGGRIVVISFHSGEDRIVKRFFKEEARECICPEILPICQCNHQKTFKIITKKPIIASKEELLINQRARSAKLRAVEKII